MFSLLKQTEFNHSIYDKSLTPLMLSINYVWKCKEECMSHECEQLKAKHGKQLLHLFQQIIMFTIYKDTHYRHTKRCPKITTMQTI